MKGYLVNWVSFGGDQEVVEIGGKPIFATDKMSC
jgi:hypothetical protein